MLFEDWGLSCAMMLAFEGDVSVSARRSGDVETHGFAVVINCEDAW